MRTSRTRSPHRVRRLTVAVLFTLALLLSGCGDGSGSDADEGASDPSDATSSSADAGSDGEDTSSPEESESPDAPSGVPVDRPSFTMELPKGFVDDTDEAMLNPSENEVDATKRKPESVEGHTLGVDFSADFHFETIQEAKELALESATSTNPQQKFLGKTTFAGEDAIRIGGPGTYDGTHRELVEFLHDGDWFQVWVETYGGKSAATDILEHIDSTWEWK